MKRYRKPLPEELKMIRKIVWSYVRSTGLEYDELFSEACLAYLESLESYDPTKSKISTYLYHTVGNRLNDLWGWEKRKREKELPIPYEDFFFLEQKQEQEGFNPEKLMLAEERWVELCGELSPEAMMVIEIVNSGTVYVNVDKKQESRRNIRNKLEEVGWKQKKISETFKEIKKLIATTA